MVIVVKADFCRFSDAFLLFALAFMGGLLRQWRAGKGQHG
jgi:hypothetical protein